MHNNLNVGSARCIIPCMRATQGSSDLPIEMGDTGGTGHSRPNPKPPPPLLPHVITPPPKGAPPPLPTPPKAQAPCVSAVASPSPIDSWCNYQGLGGCAPWDVTWRITNWQWFRWERRPHAELQLWWRYWFYRCRRCNRLHSQCYEHSTWHFDRALQPRWYRIA